MGNANETESVLHSGWLIENLGSSKRRRFVRLTNQTFYIQNEENSIDAEMINMREITKIKLCQHNPQQFELHPIQKTFICKNIKNCDEWVTALTSTVNDRSVANNQVNKQDANDINIDNNDIICTENDEHDEHEIEQKVQHHDEHNVNDRDRGELIYQTMYYTKKQMAFINDKYDEQKSPIFVFGDNDMDKNRKKEEARQHYGGQAKIMGEYDQTIAFGITTTFTNQPSLLEFIDIINKEFKQLKHFISIGRDIIIPGRDENDENIEHNIGTGIAQLATEYLQYIQVQINSLQEYANNDDSIKMEYYGYKPSDLDVSINEKEEKYEYDKQILEMENMRLKMKILEMEKEQLKKQILNTKENKDEKENEHDEELKSDISIATKGSVSDDEKSERSNSINWKWKDDNGKWISHTNTIAQMMEKCKSGHSGHFKCKSGEYFFHKMSKYYGFQVNKKTEKGYEVKRVCKSYKKNENDFNIWEWCKTDNVDMWNGDNSNAVWVAYSEDICKKIDKLKLFDSFQFNLSDYTYSIKKLSTNQCVQINLSTKTERNIRKKPVLCIESDNINDDINDADDIKSETLEKVKEFEDLKKRIGYTLCWKWQSKKNNQWESKYCEKMTEKMESLKIGQQSNIGQYFSDGRWYILSRDTFDSGVLSLCSNGKHNWPLKRFESISKDLKFDYPSYWGLKEPFDTSQSYEKPILITMSLDDNSLTHIMSLWGETMPDYDIVSVEAVKNLQLFEKYELEKKQLSKTIKLNEKWLYHKTDDNTIHAIMTEGFRSEFCERARWGQGTYFGTNPHVADVYGKDDKSVRKMFVCNVITGECFLGGNYTLKTWPKKKNGQIYDSLKNNVDPPTIFVIHSGRRAYPHFIISYRCNDNNTYINQSSYYQRNNNYSTRYNQRNYHSTLTGPTYNSTTGYLSGYHSTNNYNNNNNNNNNNHNNNYNNVTDANKAIPSKPK
eukprot:217435_1